MSTHEVWPVSGRPGLDLPECVDEGDVGREVRLAPVRERLRHEERLPASRVRQPLQRQAYVILRVGDINNVNEIVLRF